MSLINIRCFYTWLLLTTSIFSYCTGEVPRSRYLSIILERIYEKERKGGNYNVERQQTKSRLQLRQGNVDPSEVTPTDS